MGATPTLSDIRRLDLSHHDDIVRVYSEAFSDDEPLMRQLHLRRDELPSFWKRTCALFLSGSIRGRARIYGLFEEGRLQSCAMVSDDKWIPRLGALWEMVTKYRRTLGMRKLMAFMRYSLEQPLKTLPPHSCIRLHALACAHGARGRGLGTVMLGFLKDVSSLGGYNHIQLEVEEINPSRHLYHRMGYRVSRTIRLVGEPYHVMIQHIRS